MERGASLESRDRWGNVPLDDAIRSRSAEIIQLLQNKSITPAVRDTDSDSEVRIPLLTAAPAGGRAIELADSSRAGKTTAGVREFLRLAALGDVNGVQVNDLVDCALDCIALFRVICASGEQLSLTVASELLASRRGSSIC